MDELKKTAPELSKLSREAPYKVPSGYFGDFSARLHAKLEEEKTVIPEKKNRIITFLKPAIGLAASFALIFMLVYWPVNSFLKKGTTQEFSEAEYYEQEILNLLEGIDDNSLYALLDDTNGNGDYTEDDLFDYVNTNFTEYEIYMETENQ